MRFPESPSVTELYGSCHQRFREFGNRVIPSCNQRFQDVGIRAIPATTNVYKLLPSAANLKPLQPIFPRIWEPGNTKLQPKLPRVWDPSDTMLKSTLQEFENLGTPSCSQRFQPAIKCYQPVINISKNLGTDHNQAATSANKFRI